MSKPLASTSLNRNAYHLFRRTLLYTQKAFNSLAYLRHIENQALNTGLSLDEGARQNFGPVFIIGAPRSGSTLLYQLLIHHFRFSFITNVAALFYTCPVASTEFFQRWLPAYRNGSYESRYGYVKGIMAPAEADMLVEYWLGSLMADHKIDLQQTRVIEKSMHKISMIMGGPCLFKNLQLSLKIKELFAVFPHCIFIHIQRHPLFIAQSLILARRHFFNSDDVWASYDLPNKVELLQLEPFEQVARQIKTILSIIEDSRPAIPPGHIIDVSYEDLCHKPKDVLNYIYEKFKEISVPLSQLRTPDVKLTPANDVRLPPQEWEKLKAIIESLQ